MRSSGSAKTPTPVPMLDLPAEVDALWDELEPAVQRVLRSGRFIGGPEVEAFEQEVAEYLGVRHAVGLNSGTDALVIGLEALGLGPGDEVITTPYSFFATSESILRVGATPVFVDIEPDTFNLDPERIEGAITERTKAIVPVHLFGMPAHMGRVMEIAERHGLWVLEDAAQAFGATYSGSGYGEAARGGTASGRKVGAIGHAGAFSFFPTKNLGAFGDAGLLVSDDQEVAASARSLRGHGALPAQKYRHGRLGHNSRLDALQAAVLRVKLPHVDAMNARRREVAQALHAGLCRVAGVTPPPPHADHVFHQFTVRIPPDRREAHARALEAAGVAAQHFYPATLDTQPEDGVERGCGSCVRARAAAEEALSLPVHPGLSAEQVERIVAAVAEGAAGG